MNSKPSIVLLAVALVGLASRGNTTERGASPAGWAKVSTTSDSWVCASEIYGDRVAGGVAGVGCQTESMTDFCLPHYVSSEQWYTAVALVNSSATKPAQVRFTAYDNEGIVLAFANRTIAAGSSICESVSTLLGIDGDGWIKVQSDVPLVGTEIYGEKINGGMGAMRVCGGARHAVIPHVHVDHQTWTGVAVTNPSSDPVSVALKLYSDDGVLEAEAIYILPPRGKLLRLVDHLFPEIQDAWGWIEVDADRDVAVMSCYGFPSFGQIASSVAVEPNEILRIPVCNVGDGWWTGLAVVNPSLAVASVTVEVFDENGASLARMEETLAAKSRLIGMADDLLDLAYPTTGWIEIRSDVPLAALVTLQYEDEETSGLVSISPVSPRKELLLPHVASDARWWTLVHLAHPLQGEHAQGEINCVAPDGVGLGRRDFYMVPRGRSTYQGADLMVK